MNEATRQRAGAYSVLGAFLLLACATARTARNADRRQGSARSAIQGAAQGHAPLNRDSEGAAGVERVEDAKVYWQRAQRFPRNPEAA